ncbi:hypothetical protein ACHAW6_007242 [Cyclotella cf. meneghiniana]
MSPMSRDSIQSAADVTSTSSRSSSKQTASRSPPPPPPGPPPDNVATRTPPGNATPSRPRNNYADETTPIASAKRPAGKRRAPGNQIHSTPRTPMDTTPLGRQAHHCMDTAATREDELTPMHSVKPVPRNSHRVPVVREHHGEEEALARTLLVDDELGEFNQCHRAHLGDAADGAHAHIAAAHSHDSELSIITEHKDQHSAAVTATSSWVGRKVDALFSPVLSFLNGAKDADTVDAHEEQHDVHKDFYAEKTLRTDASQEVDDDEEKSIAVSVAIRAALLEASKELQSEEQNAAATTTNNSASYEEQEFDRVPLLAETDSTSKDADGDFVMVDSTANGISRQDRDHRHFNQRRRNDDTDSYANGDKTSYCIDREEPEDNDYTYHVPSNVANKNNNNNDDAYDDEEEFNPYLFIKSLPPYHYAIPPGWSTRSKSLPPHDPSDPPICLVLDLDETLVHCTVEPIRNADMVFPVEFNGIEYTVHVRCRPYLKEFLERVSGKFEVVVFTASQQVYADKLLDKIDPEGKYIRHRMFRDSCLPVEGNFLKDLNILGRDLRRAVLVDNSPHAFGYQVDNGIPIESWFDDPADTELLKLERFLRTLHGKEDVREVVREKFQTYRLVSEA